MQTMTAVEAHALVEREAQEKATPEVRDVRKTLVPGKVVRQGDVYLVRVAEGKAMGGKEIIATGQLVDGTTRGSRHIAAGEGVTVYRDPLPRSALPECVRPDALLGPVIVAKVEFTVAPPEHAHVRCPAGKYQVIHQLDAATRQRVQD